MLEQAYNISGVIALNTQNNDHMMGFGGFIHLLDTLTGPEVWDYRPQG